MSEGNRMKSFKIILLALVVLGLTYCNQGDTGGGLDNSFPGSPLISDASTGISSLTIEVRDMNVPLGGSLDFVAQARDANGAPLPFIPITCDTEQGLALLEPTVNPANSTTAGVANTSSGGGMSGTIGGLAPGSFIMECRGPASTGLIARKGFRVGGTAPSGFIGFNGAAGGGLGGGVADGIDTGGTTGGTTTGGTTTGGDDTGGDTGGTTTGGISDVEEVTFNDAVFRTVSGTSQTGEVDTFQNPDCNSDDLMATTILPETFTNDFAVFNISNNRSSEIQIDTITYSVQGVVSSTFTQFSQVIIPGNSTNTTLEALFTDVVFGGSGDKEYVGTSVFVSEVTTNVTFTITGANIDGSEPFTLFRSAVIAADNYDLCPS